MPSVSTGSRNSLNDQCENSHRPTQQRERAMNGFRTVGSAQRFLSSISRI
ncbi:hypothetical protein [Rhodococcus jostii]